MLASMGVIWWIVGLDFMLKVKAYIVWTFPRWCSYYGEECNGCSTERRCSSPGVRALHLSQTGISMCGHQQGSENHQKCGN